MAAKHGRKAIFKLDDSGGSLVDISPYLDTASLANAVEQADVTTLGKDGRCFIPGLTNETLQASGPYDKAVYTQVSSLFQADATSSFEFYPGGTASGEAKVTGECWVSGLNLSSGVGGRADMSFSLQVNDQATYGTVA